MRGVIFDFDGTILDTETPEYEAWQILCADHGVNLPIEVWATCVGVGVEENPFNPYQYLSERAGEAYDENLVRTRRRGLFTERLALQKIRSGIVAYLDEAEKLGIAIGLASSSRHDWVDPHLERLGLLERFPVRVCADDVTRTKPHPDLYLRCLAELGLKADEAIALEDSPNGVRAAKAAGIYCVHYPNPLTKMLVGAEIADRQIDDLATCPLPTLLAEIEAERSKSSTQ